MAESSSNPFVDEQESSSSSSSSSYAQQHFRHSPASSQQLNSHDVARANRVNRRPDVREGL